MFKLKAISFNSDQSCMHGQPCMHDWSELKDIDFSESLEFTTKKIFKFNRFIHNCDQREK